MINAKARTILMAKWSLIRIGVICIAAGLGVQSECVPNAGRTDQPLDLETAPRVPIDRFSTAASTLYVRDGSNNLPGVNEPIADIFVTFNINPDEQGGGPASGLPTETGTDQTHSVLASLPDDEAYSPLWFINVYDTADFEAVFDLATALSATPILMAQTLVNCPVVAIDAP